jgi:hypothetical protein
VEAARSGGADEQVLIEEVQSNQAGPKKLDEGDSWTTGE